MGACCVKDVERNLRRDLQRAEEERAALRSEIESLGQLVRERAAVSASEKKRTDRLTFNDEISINEESNNSMRNRMRVDVTSGSGKLSLTDAHKSNEADNTDSRQSRLGVRPYSAVQERVSTAVPPERVGTPVPPAAIVRAQYPYQYYDNSSSAQRTSMYNSTHSKGSHSYNDGGRRGGEAVADPRSTAEYYYNQALVPLPRGELRLTPSEMREAEFL